MRPLLEAIHDHLGGVFIERLPWEMFLASYHGASTLFLVDLPYWGAEGYYGASLFARADHARLAAALQGLQYRFILTLNDCPEVRALYQWATLEGASLNYRVSGGVTSATELIISSPGREANTRAI